MDQLHAKPLMNGSFGPPPSFANFTAMLRHANTSWELVRNIHHWQRCHGGARGDDDGEGKEDEERVWAVKAPSDDEEMDLEQESRGNKPMVTKDNSK